MFIALPGTIRRVISDGRGEAPRRRRRRRDASRRTTARILGGCFFLVSAKKRNFFHSPPRGGAHAHPPALLSVCRLVRNVRSSNERTHIVPRAKRERRKTPVKGTKGNSRVESGIVVKHRNACTKVVRFSFARSSVSPARARARPEGRIGVKRDDAPRLSGGPGERAVSLRDGLLQLNPVEGVT